MKFISAKDFSKESVSVESEETLPARGKPKRASKAPTSSSASAQTVALRLLSMRDHSSLQLREKLSERGFSPKEIEETLQFLKEKRFLDDLRYGRALIRIMAERKYFGAYKIRMELSRRIDREYVDALLPEELEQYDFAALAEEFAKKSQHRGRSREQMIRKLKAQGYAVSEIRFALAGMQKASEE